MSEITREEMDAKMAAVEARMDTRIEKFERAMESAVASFRLDLVPLKGLRTSIWSAVAVIVATFIATFALSFAAFDTGRETTNLVSEAKLLQQQTAADFKAQNAALVAAAVANQAAITAQLDKVQRQTEEAQNLLHAIQAKQEQAEPRKPQAK